MKFNIKNLFHLMRKNLKIKLMRKSQKIKYIKKRQTEIFKKRLTSKICPFCSEPVTNSYPNLALLELLPESEYDKNKTECIKVLVQ